MTYDPDRYERLRRDLERTRSWIVGIGTVVVMAILAYAWLGPR